MPLACLKRMGRGLRGHGGQSPPDAVTHDQFGRNMHLTNHPLIIRGTVVYLAFQDLMQFFKEDSGQPG